ncbi:Lactose permease [Verticillium dahliae VDG2]|nr:Lactose permease [Verticillium dahliae VDG2]
MKSPIPDYLNQVLKNARDNEDGAPAAYIETLAKADTSRLAVALAMVDGNIYSAGDDEVEFSIQSISKAFVYAIAIEDAGLERVLEKIGVEPSGDAFNRLSLHKGTNRPMNPMINAGAITAHSLVVRPDATAEERTERILKTLSRLAGRELHVDEEVYEAELRDADRNMGIGYMLKAAGIITCDPREAVKGYIRQCAINVNVRDLAMMAATLCNAGLHPVSGERIIHQASVRQVLSVMTTCGMYDAAGDWVSNVGIPAKSGVAGGIIGALPGQLGRPNPDDPGSGLHGDACAVIFSFREVYSLNHVARRIIHEDISRLILEEKIVVVIDPSGVLQWNHEEAENDRHPKVVKNETEARDFIGGTGCKAVSTDDGW